MLQFLTFWRMSSDFVCYHLSSNTFKGSTEMSLCLNLKLNNHDVSVIFDWSGRDEDSGPNWETLEVHALLPVIPQPAKESPKRHWVIVNELISDDDWVYIEMEIYAQRKELERQARSNDY